MREYRIRPNEAGQRLDKFLRKLFPGAGASFLYRMMRKKNILLNDGKCAGSERLLEGDSVRVWFSEETIEKFSAAGSRETARDSAEKADLRKADAANPASKKNRSKKTGSKKPDAGEIVPEECLSAFRSKILYENADILILDKPAGLLTQRAHPEDLSVNELLLSYLMESGSLTEEDLRAFRPSAANRLDRNTSGLLLAGKTLSGLQVLSAHIRDRSIEKFYLCAVSGRIEAAGELRGFLRKNPRTNQVSVSEQRESNEDMEIRTAWQPVARGENRTLLRVRLITGRPHQIRAHLRAAGHPVLGDPKYGDTRLNRELSAEYHLHRQLLHAYELHFPKTEERPLAALSGRSIFAPVPPEFFRLFPGLRLPEDFRDRTP